MKRTALLTLIVTCALARTTSAQFATVLPSSGMRDTALLMLQEFVTKGGDLKLGFTRANVMQAELDTAQPVTFYYIGTDSLEHATNPHGMAILVHVNKVLYPVKVGDRICGSISFGYGISGRWSIREFQDSTEMIEYMNSMAILTPVGGSNGLMAAYIPAINQTVILQGDSAHIVVTPTKTRSASQPLPQSLMRKQVSLEEFMKACDEHVATRRKR